MINIKVKKLTPEAVIPAYQSAEAAGFDLHSVEDYVLKVGTRKLIKTGLSMSFPKGYEIQIRPRSGLAYKHGITCLNTPGTIDSDYRGEFMVLLINHGEEDFHIAKGERIAQAVLKEVLQGSFLEVEDLDDTARGAGGFGSTGK